MLRVVGTDPGTSSLDLLLLSDGEVVDQARLEPGRLRDEPALVADLLARWKPLDLVSAPSGYGLPLIRGVLLTEDHLEQLSLVRTEERGRDMGVMGFRSWVRAFLASGVPTVFLPGGLHLPTIPPHRKVGAIDLGTADKIAVAALALHVDVRYAGGFDQSTFALVEIGSAFSAVLVVNRGRIVDASAGSRGPIGLRSGGAWDGEVACWRKQISKEDLFRGGMDDLGSIGPDAFRESLRRHVAGLRSITPFDRIYISGRGLERPEVSDLVDGALSGLGQTLPLPGLPGAWVKHSAQGAAILADALAGGRFAAIADSLHLTEAAGSVWDVLERPAQ